MRDLCKAVDDPSRDAPALKPSSLASSPSQQLCKQPPRASFFAFLRSRPQNSEAIQSQSIASFSKIRSEFTIICCAHCRAWSLKAPNLVISEWHLELLSRSHSPHSHLPLHPLPSTLHPHIIQCRLDHDLEAPFSAYSKVYKHLSS